ncbi:MAG TPA: CoA-transferase, partial [Candidatus Cloacimonadota bacterium]|nr:CoA-transferase [Candidatus Cloacimonadota bacterium]
LVTGARKVIVAMEHCDKNGNSKILNECTLPLTAKGKVSLIVTDIAVIEVTPKGLILLEVAEGVTVSDVVKLTEAPLIVSDELGVFGDN